MHTPTKRHGAIALSLAALLALAGCAPAGDGETHESHDDHEGHDHGASTSEATETAGPEPRLVVTYDGGLKVIDAKSLEVIADFPLDGYNRVNPAGDGRHVLVSTTGGWQLLDTGTWTEAHGDHGHSYVADPVLTDLVIAAEMPGHVVNHGGKTTLFDDGTGKVQVFDSAAWADAAAAGEASPVLEYTTDEAHHGVAVPTEAGLFVTVGNEEARTGAQIVDDSGETIAISDECPGLHGETVFGEDSVLAGCENGVLLQHGDHFHHVASPDDFGRIGNAFASDGSDIVLTDYKTDPEAGIELEQIALVNVESEELKVVDLEATYTWRGLARGIDGSVLVLGTDGSLRVLDPETGDVKHTVSVIDSWTPPEEWQGSHPALVENDGFVYVTDPASGTITVVDYAAGEVVNQATIDAEANEVAVADASMQ